MPDTLMTTDDAFSKKRRNLLLVTSVLLFLKYADAEVQNSSSISVLKFQVGNPDAIIQAIWFIWVYFFLRAHQHFLYYLRKEYNRATQKTVVPLMHPYLSGAGVPLERERFFFEDLERFHNYDLKFRPQFILEDFYRDWQFIVRALRRCLPRSGARSGKRINLLRYGPNYWSSRGRRYGSGDAWRIEIWTVTDRSVIGGGKMPIEVAAQVGIGFVSGLLLKIKIIISLVIRSAPFFEMRLPFLYALLPLVYYGYEPLVRVAAQLRV